MINLFTLLIQKSVCPCYQFLFCLGIKKEKSKFKCKLCNKLFSTLTLMRNHMKFHLKWNNSRQKILKAACSTCGMVIRKGNVFDKHNCTSAS